MIGVGIFISDVHQPNKDGEQRHKEKYHKGQLGNGRVQKAAGPLDNGQNVVGGVEGHLVGQVTFDVIFFAGLFKIEKGVLFYHMDKELHFVGKATHSRFRTDAVEITIWIGRHQRILVYFLFRVLQF
jgi:hypothetical protein|tara:strand:+ start:178 stop:558 length:381 start_codon:yes stop_codon:yes gene_type:complete